MPDSLDDSIQVLKNVGPSRAEDLGRLGITTVRDLLFHFPRAYDDLTDVRPIARLCAGMLQTVQGEVVEVSGRRLADGRPLVSVVISDGKDALEGVWFNQTYAAQRFRYGQRVGFSGKPKWYRDHWQMSAPRVQPLDAGDGTPEGKIVPVYPLTEGIRPEHLRALIRGVVARFADLVPDILPEELRRKKDLPQASQALRDVHLAPTVEAAQRARRRFVYEEFLLLQVGLAVRRRELRDRLRAPILIVSAAVDARIRRLFPFQFTGDQGRAVADICRDLASERPMQRLLQADVGAGKTAVAVYALLATVANKHQAVLMAPTEVLAQQHWRVLEGYLARSRVRRMLLIGGLGPREKREALEGVRQGEIDLVVGTQALVDNEVQFRRLGLVVIDEQHRFGVRQRAGVRKLGIDPHYLVMTATPIPRTVGLTVFGDLDVSVIRELPPGRQPVATGWVPARLRDRTYERLREELARGRQAYVVCPLVAPSERRELKTAIQTHAELQAGPFRDFQVGLLHGSLDEAAKTDVMERFRHRDLDVLVCTTVVEVGVDVPNATLLLIEHAERFGLSQLHQLRGRVSRGDVAGQCYIFADPTTDEARERLKLFTRTTDGFMVAEHDLRLRGVGEFFGTKQHGLGEFRIGDLVKDAELLRLARRDAIDLVALDAGLRLAEHALLRKAVLARYGRSLDLATIG
jgi:ATP-dependent DNA helicase RecG